MVDISVEFHDVVHGRGDHGQNRGILQVRPPFFAQNPRFLFRRKRAVVNAHVAAMIPHELCDGERHKCDSEDWPWTKHV